MTKGFDSMKRILALLLLIGLAGLGIAGCSPDDETAADVAPATVAVADDNTQSTAPDEVVPQIADSPVETETVPEGDASTPDASPDSEIDVSSIRGPISILGNADFTAENGVVGGTGTTDDPYVIAAWEIIVPSGEYYGVRIENVTAQFELRGLVIQNATEIDGAGIRVGFATGGHIEGCSVANSMNGVVLVSSTDIAMENNLLYVSGRGLEVIGESAEQYRHSIADTNLYNNYPIYYFYGLDGETISHLSTSHLTVAGSRNVTISNNEVVNGDGLLLAFVEDSTVSMNVAHRTANVVTAHGIHLYESDNNIVSGNGIKNNRLAGIQLTLANSNTILENLVYVNNTGVRVFASDDNDIRSNEIYGNVAGIALLGGASDNLVAENVIGDDNENMTQGISLTIALSNSIERNLIFGGETAILIAAQALSNTLAENTVVAGGYGIYNEGSNNTIARNLISQFTRAIMFPETYGRSVTQNNTLVGNVLAENVNHVYANLDSAGNTFAENAFLNAGRDLVDDKGTGNLWMKDGVGNFWGFRSVTDADGDGIGDQPITVPSSGFDDTAPIANIDARELGLGIVGTLDLGVTTIETADGSRIDVPAYVADKSYSRMTGFRGFPSELIAGFPGILFAFDEERPTTSGFTMLTVPFDLDIAFFNATGEWVGSTTMVAQATAMYTAGAPYQYALELPSGSLEALGIGAGSTLVLP